jgi:hypothetical protein
MVIDRFEEEETRLASLSSDQMRMLRGGAAPIRDSSELTAEGVSASRRARRDSEEEMTRAREPIDLGKLDGYQKPFDTPTDDTRLIAPRDRRTPVPGMRTTNPPRNARDSTAPPPMPSRGRGPTPGPPLPGMPPPLSVQPAPGMAPLPSPPGTGAPLGSALGAAPGVPPFVPSQPAGGYPNWGSAGVAPQIPVRDATPTTQDAFDRPVYPSRPAQPQVAGFNRMRTPVLKPWMLVVGALVMALLAFAITRAFIG